MKPLAAMIAALGLSACGVAGPDIYALSDTENQFLARNYDGSWADATPLAGLQASGSANCATTSKGSACVLSSDGTTPDSSLATVHEGRCIASWSQGTGTQVATVTLQRNGRPAPQMPLRDRLYYALNSGRAFDATPRLTDAAAFTRLCDQLLQPELMMTRVPD